MAEVVEPAPPSFGGLAVVEPHLTVAACRHRPSTARQLVHLRGRFTEDRASFNLWSKPGLNLWLKATFSLRLKSKLKVAGHGHRPSIFSCAISDRSASSTSHSQAGSVSHPSRQSQQSSHNGSILLEVEVEAEGCRSWPSPFDLQLRHLRPVGFFDFAFAGGFGVAPVPAVPAVLAQRLFAPVANVEEAHTGNAS